MLKNIKICMDDYGCGDDTQWGNNIISNEAIQEPSGRIAYKSPIITSPDKDALRRCKLLERELAELAAGLGSVWGSEGDEAIEPFYVANHDGWNCSSIDIQQVRKIFSTTLYPRAEITVQNLDALSSRIKQNYGAGNERWKKLMDWFSQNPEFVESKYVEINKKETGMPGPGYLTSKEESGSKTSENVITTRHSAVCKHDPDPNRV